MRYVLDRFLSIQGSIRLHENFDFRIFQYFYIHRLSTENRRKYNVKKSFSCFLDTSRWSLDLKIGMLDLWTNQHAQKFQILKKKVFTSFFHEKKMTHL